ncbi:hypothetical protein N7474_001548 [Penicillium riverlandense]|uniref:uncharacterized protein n=1 Tax=Penicillium riverlandense TaxID=1903569 RepID=UPI00254993C7|nr:uncharacterized protein N7474_001548 [Penicillium riverlandense]KAJ5833237.1 hypothetical protein N7474_001548 [Penicillium riverlandense]
MFRPAARALVRRAPAVAGRGAAGSRLISTGPAPKSRSWKSTAVRLGLAAGAVYYYNTSSVFAQEPTFSLRPSPQNDSENEHSTQTLDSITPKIREERQQQQRAAAFEGGVNPQELEEEAGQEAAFNPETGEINWDCPCLGGMAHGPCGEEFKAAFSCFVYSQEEPKGIECIEKFKGMQDCFRQHPDVYGAELEDDEEIEGAAPAPSPDTAAPAVEGEATADSEEKRARAKEVHTQMKTEAAEKGEQTDSELLPKAVHDTEEKNEAVLKTEK